MKSTNPFNNEVIKEYDEFSAVKVEEIILKAKTQFSAWSDKSFDERATLFLNLSKVLKKNKNEYAMLMTKEMGKPISQGDAEIEKCALVCEYYAKNAKEFLSDKDIASDYKLSKVVYKPLGVVLGIMPWNYPFWQVLRFAAPTMMAGNCVVLKHASNVTGCALAIEKAFKEAGFVDHTFTTLVISSSKIKAVIENNHLNAVSLTGSTQAGKKVAELCGANLKKCLLELGGSDPYIIFEDADLKSAAKLCVESRMQNNGQSCIGAKRFIVQESIYDEFVGYFKDEMKSYEINDPSNDDCKLGPMARVDLRDDLFSKVNICKELGAKISLGQDSVSDKDAFFRPTIIENITKNMPAYSEEFFGPVASILKFKDTEEAIQIANDTVFGLGSGIFTSNIDLAMDIATNKLDAGASFINSYVKSNPKFPFGGVKESGFGRELSSNGILEFVNIKTICIGDNK